MKHTLKIILPIILILAIVIGACWFFLIARRDVTESIFVYWGEHFYEAGRYSRAVAFYKAAMRFAPKDAELAIRLADAYKQSGNYTKAEYTLVSAITQIPDSVSLYVALSGTYVEQDKLLDAETMLSRITNDAVRTQIDALRPRRARHRAGKRQLLRIHRCDRHRLVGHGLRRVQQRFPRLGAGHLYRPHFSGSR